jgi:hypothetical protein
MLGCECIVFRAVEWLPVNLLLVRFLELGREPENCAHESSTYVRTYVPPRAVNMIMNSETTFLLLWRIGFTHARL